MNRRRFMTTAAAAIAGAAIAPAELTASCKAATLEAQTPEQLGETVMISVEPLTTNADGSRAWLLTGETADERWARVVTADPRLGLRQILESAARRFGPISVNGGLGRG